MQGIMLDDVLTFLRDAVNDHLAASLGLTGTHPDQSLVVFTDSAASEAIEFRLGSVTLLLVNLEQEHTLRSGDPYRMTMADGSSQRVQPPIHLNAYVLFAARCKEYQQSLKYISLILSYFQHNRVLDHEKAPALSERIEKLVIELVTLPLSEQHNLWSMLRSNCQPALLYKVRMVSLHDADGPTLPALSAPSVRLRTQP